jgi:hypothetical protein
MSNPLLDHIFYINLDSRPDRNEHILQEFQKLPSTLNPERFPAICPISGNGALGCSLSHNRCLEMAKERAYPYVLICEDDITFLQPDLLLKNIQRFWDQSPPTGWDVLIICGNNFQPFDEFSEYAIQVHFCAASTGYIVAQHYYDILLANFKESARNLETTTHTEKYAIDVQWRKLQEPTDSRWYMIIPPTATQYQNYSNIEHCHVNYEGWLLDYHKRNY